MKIVVIGGQGLIGSKLVKKLGDQGHHAVAACPSTGVDALTGEGLAAALEGADVVVDVCNSPSWDDDAVMNFFRTSTGNLLAAEQAAGVGHHVALSVVGCDRLPDSGYMRAKVAQEELIEASPVPYSIVRATQFFEFVETIAYAADDVARAVGRTAVGSPVGGIVEIAGPETYRFDELIGQALSARNDSRRVVVDPDARYFSAGLSDAELLPGEDAQLGETRFEDWLRQPAAAG